MIEILTAVMGAGDSRDFHINGEYLEILDAQYPVDILLMDKSGAQQSTMKQSEASFFTRPKEGFQTIKVTSAQAQIVRMFVGSGDAGTRRISSTVQVVDGERLRAIAGAAFMATAYQGPVAGQVPSVQIWNPVGTGKRLIVGQVSAASDTAQGVVCGFTQSGLTTDSTATRVASRLSGVGPGVAQSRNQAGVSLGGVPIILNYTVQANQMQRFTPKGAPFVVLPGWALTVQGTTNPSSLTCEFEFFEELI